MPQRALQSVHCSTPFVLRHSGGVRVERRYKNTGKRMQLISINWI